MNPTFTLAFSNEAVRELFASHLDDNVFSMSVNNVDITSLVIDINPDGSMRVAGNFLRESV